ncbi:unnamed protein product [Polarella glacialis]|uniref:Uncharacterized protein n=1 Tax=Polarella glacialis TaxID=89957 RepID=A0A813FBX7_POLGL|nr:unnamed protein product [Polarella glacialis]
MLGLMGFWMLGERLRGVRTMENTMMTQLQMLIGEFIRADGSEHLNGELNVMYWIYASTFLACMVFLLLNFLLAITVDSFVAVKKNNDEKDTVRDFPADIVHVLVGAARAKHYGWPSHNDLLLFLDCVDREGQTRSTERKSIISKMKEEKSSSKWSLHLRSFCPHFQLTLLGCVWSQCSWRSLAQLVAFVCFFIVFVTPDLVQ